MSATDAPTCLFPRPNEIKPEMLAEATPKVREAAEQFAEDADSDIAGIRRASQVEKKVRVVTTVEYLLED